MKVHCRVARLETTKWKNDKTVKDETSCEDRLECSTIDSIWLYWFYIEWG